MTPARRTISFVTLFLMLTPSLSGIAQGETLSNGSATSSILGADINIPVVPKGHPRVYIRPDDLPEIKAKLNSPEFAASWASVRDSRRPFCQAFVCITCVRTASSSEAETPMTAAAGAIPSGA